MKKTITKAHHKIYRAVAGAVINTAHGHPRWHISVTMANSIAKRATGTLTAEWPEVLAAHKPSESASESSASREHWPPVYRYGPVTVTGRGSQASHGSPFSRKLIKHLSKEAGIARREGKQERLEALIETLRFIDKLR